MSNADEITKKNVVRAIIEKINTEDNHTRIFTDYFTGYHSPEKLNVKDKIFKPDLTTDNNEQVDIYEVELEQKNNITKWKVFSDYACNKNGNFFIILPESNSKTIKSILTEQKIKANLIYFSA